MGSIEIDLKKMINEKTKIVDKNVNSTADKILNQIEQHIRNGNNSCFLVSGYRGTGKSTIIEKLEKKMNDDTLLFVKLNISKYEEHCYIMRKLIREIYRIYTSKSIENSFLDVYDIKRVFDKEYRQSYKNKKNIKDKEENFRKKLELLYDRTFNEITSRKRTKNTLNLSINFTKESSIKRLAEISISLVTMVYITKLNFNYNWLKNLLTALNILWTVIATFKIIVKFSKEQKISEEIDRKSLYDNEIAELKLVDILRELDELGYKVVIILDELDKVECEDDINKILCEFKPLLISELATFIVISGQRLYYNLANSKIIDDSLISNIFSKTIHIPLSSYDMLSELFSNAINTSDISDNTKKIYVDSVILRSNTTIRLFINIILQDITWNNNKAYILINKNDIGKFETDSKILKAIEEVIAENIVPFDDLDMVIKDFLICQLYLWAKKMKLIGKDSFRICDIYNFNDDYSSIYPRWCEIQLSSLLNNLLEKLANTQKIMEKEEKEGDDETFYKWIDGINMIEESDMEKNAKGKIKFLDEFIIVEKYCREIHTVINKTNNEISLKKIILNLYELDIIEEKICEKLRVYLSLRNKIVHGEYVEDMGIYNTNITGIIAVLIEKYSYYACKEHLEKKGYIVEVDNGRFKMGYDFIARSKYSEVDDILVIVKYRRHMSKIINNKLANNLLLTMKNYNYKKQCRLVALIYTEEHINNSINYLESMISSENLNIIYISNIIKLNLGDYLNKIINSKNDFIVGSPCQMSGQKCPGCKEGILDVSDSGDGVECNKCGIYIAA